MQKLFIAGACGKDAELRHTQNGDPVLGFSIAVSNGKDRDGSDRPPTWWDASLWGKRAEGLAPHIKKGDKLALTGRPSVRVYEGKAFLQISVDDLTFMGSSQQRDDTNRDDTRDTRSSPRPDRDDPRTNTGTGGGARYDDMDDSIPF